MSYQDSDGRENEYLLERARGRGRERGRERGGEGEGGREGGREREREREGERGRGTEKEFVIKYLEIPVAIFKISPLFSATFQKSHSQ